MLTLFAWGRLPVILLIFAFALWYYRGRISPRQALKNLYWVLFGVLITSVGDWAMARGNMIGGCVFFGMAHLCWFKFMIKHGYMSWKFAGLLTFILLPFLAVAVFPEIPNALKIAFSAYAFCSIISVSTAFGRRKLPGGIWFLGGTGSLLISDVFIAVRLIGFRWAELAVIPIYLLSVVLMNVALIRSIPLTGQPVPDAAELSGAVQRYRNSLSLLVMGCMMPLFFIAAMFCYNGSYCWYSQYISGSGLVFVENNTANHWSAWLLTSGLTGSALLCCWYFAERFRWGNGSRLLRGLILVFGALGSCGLAGIGAVPFDQHPNLHNFFTLCSIPFGMAIVCAALTGNDRFGRSGEKIVWLIFMLFVVAVFGGLSFLCGIDHGGLPSYPTGPFMQKMLVLAFYIYMLGQVITYTVSCRQENMNK